MTPETQRAILARIQSLHPVLDELGRTIDGMQSGDLQIQSKSTQMDLVTAADFHSDSVLRAHLSKVFPNDGILSEETGQTQGSSDFQWVIDPLDGTINYAHGLPLYAISIGLMHEDKPIAGMIEVPGLGHRYEALPGLATKNKKPIHVSKRSPLERSLIVTGFPYHRDLIADALVLGVRQMLLLAGGIRRTGSAALDLCWLADGKFDGLYELRLSPWDTCAGTVLVRNAGGRATDIAGREHHPTMMEIAGSNGLIHDELIAALSVVRAEAAKSKT